VRVHPTLSTVLSLVTLGLGLALIGRTLAEGGGEVGILLGLLFAAAGAGRLYVSRKGIR
jgi:hypothetical protein